MTPKATASSASTDNNNNSNSASTTTTIQQQQSKRRRRRLFTSPIAGNRIITMTQQDTDGDGANHDHDNNNNMDDIIDDKPLEAYIPAYLRNWIHPYHTDFCYARLPSGAAAFHPQLLCQVLAEGFLTIATNDGRILLPKLHEQRSVIYLNQPPQKKTATKNRSAVDGGGATRTQQNTAANGIDAVTASQPRNNAQQKHHNKNPPQPLFHVSKSVRKKANAYYWSVNQNFDAVVQGCRTQHAPHCWLYPSLVQTFKLLHYASGVARVVVDNTTADGDGKITTKTIDCPVRVVSIEIYKRNQVDASYETKNDDDNGDDDDSKDATATTGEPTYEYELVAGELGYTVGTMYTSLTGFCDTSRGDGAGSVQLACLGRILQHAGFRAWDLGMDMAYKTALGAMAVPRAQFVQLVHECRAVPTPLMKLTVAPKAQQEQTMTTAVETDFLNCRTLLDQTAAAATTTTTTTNAVRSTATKAAAPNRCKD